MRSWPERTSRSSSISMRHRRRSNTSAVWTRGTGGPARRGARVVRPAHAACDEGDDSSDPCADDAGRGRRSRRALLHEHRFPRGRESLHRAAQACMEGNVSRFHEEQHFHDALMGLLVLAMIFIVGVTVLAVVLSRPNDALLLATAPVVVVLVAALISQPPAGSLIPWRPVAISERSVITSSRGLLLCSSVSSACRRSSPLSSGRFNHGQRRPSMTASVASTCF